MTGSRRVVVIGASAAGVTAVKEMRGKNGDIEIILIGDEPHIPYYRPYLTEYIGDPAVVNKSNFHILSREWCDEQKVELRLDERIVALDTAKKTATGSSGARYGYDALIIACGSSPFVPFPDSMKMKNVFAIRTMDDAERVHRYAGGVKKAAVVGGGLLGLEAAFSLLRRGVRVSVIELSERLLPNQLDGEGSRFFQERISQRSLSLHLGKRITGIEGSETARGVALDGGDVIDADMVIFSVGVRANAALAGGAGIRVNRGIIVNERMETSASDVYACGDVAELNGRSVSLWMNAVRQGRIAGLNAAGERAELGREIYPAVLNSFGTRIFSVEMCSAMEGAPARETRCVEAGQGVCKKLFFKNDVLAGFYLIGDIAESQRLLSSLKAGISYGDVREAFPAFS
ncbi:MAG: NAD(P)/FAD-dependent oxidoreductase [Spirochaetes bacterium]|nr:NAD(P)/FAD-dependent oxidoreductase [Spirochaetota bacterium]